ncbi:S24 family peptidase [Alteraurantiacibacter aquimixticola]|uniref:LexA family transcriptional regulator n=1 Tax=Alteraurantiacibacter aquimixticola TaxID=2489173 RepID=A0A4T3F630_9SPHN|nr:S24 family peptidase [Alteraurantiacibacter aquimixticola]TIX51864.1 LexA family transcriptional regulator [Alteraurantiacibacter aquimixticola]
MDPRQRLSELVREKGTSLASLSRMLGRNTTYLQQYISKGSPRKLEEDDRRKLARFFGVPETELGASQEKSYEAERDWVEVPRLSVEASAGPGASNAAEQAFDSFRFSRRWLREQGLRPGSLSAVRVIGDSMEPLLREGDDLLVDMSDRPFRDGIFVVRLDDSLLVKRVTSQGGGRFSLLSQNLSYPPLSVQGEQIELVGRVVWKSGKL